MSLRLSFVQQATPPGANVRALCEQFGISRTTGYLWLTRFQAGGVAALREQSRRPQTQPQHTPAAVEERVLALRAQHPQWGGRKLRARLQALEPDLPVPAASTITTILRRHGVLDVLGAPQPVRAPALQRFEHPAPNDLWQMDFKGHLPYLAAPGRCHPLTVLDDHSRFALAIVVCADERRSTVQAVLMDLFRRYGVPLRILCDNGSPWGSAGAATPWTRLTVWLLRHGIAVSHGQPAHPQTQGKDERFHRTLLAEVLSAPLVDPAEAQHRCSTWEQVYNYERPHEALQLAVPASRYVPSPRPFQETLPPLEYDTTCQVRHVQHNGWLHWQGHVYHVGKAFVGQPVGIRPTDLDGCFTVYFAEYPIATLDTRVRRAYPVLNHRTVVNHVPEQV